mmetsp:Transcript_10846/g.17372  ORF Transcript_10846/g.17372 Transcript_10846/m.17372 type:complete len:213 (-) Transcript_10846:26-664(-)
MFRPFLGEKLCWHSNKRLKHPTPNPMIPRIRPRRTANVSMRNRNLQPGSYPRDPGRPTIWISYKTNSSLPKSPHPHDDDWWRPNPDRFMPCDPPRRPKGHRRRGVNPAMMLGTTTSVSRLPKRTRSPPEAHVPGNWSSASPVRHMAWGKRRKRPERESKNAKRQKRQKKRLPTTRRRRPQNPLRYESWLWPSRVPCMGCVKGLPATMPVDRR